MQQRPFRQWFFLGLLLATLIGVFGRTLFAEDEARFPPPEFTPGYYQIPTAEQPASSRTIGSEALDCGVLLLTLGLATWAILFKRDRRLIVALSILSLAYFGFWREGCVCPIGSIQNVAQALFDPTTPLPLTTLLIFLMPLLFALFFGRIFCGAVCPLGILQDLVLLRPLSLPTWADHVLGLFRYAYLGLGVFLAAMGAAFLICEYDPFVSFFRFSGSVPILCFGGVLLLLGTVIARPYCRFLCPYGALLGLASLVARRGISVTPTDCITCHLCKNSCPQNAIRPPEGNP